MFGNLAYYVYITSVRAVAEGGQGVVVGGAAGGREEQV